MRVSRVEIILEDSREWQQLPIYIDGTQLQVDQNCKSIVIESIKDKKIPSYLPIYTFLPLNTVDLPN